MTPDQIRVLDGLNGTIHTKHRELYGPGVLSPGLSCDDQEQDVECLIVRDKYGVEVWVPVVEIEEITLR